MADRSTDPEVFDPVSATRGRALRGPFDAAVLSQTRRARFRTNLRDGHDARGRQSARRRRIRRIDNAAGVSGDSRSDTWHVGADKPSMPRARQTATRLANGIGVLIAGGIDELGPSRSAEIFHPVPALVPGISSGNRDGGQPDLSRHELTRPSVRLVQAQRC